MSYRSMNLSGLGQTPAPATSSVPIVALVGGLILLTVVGAKSAERHQRSLYANRSRRRHGRRRKKR